MQQISMFDGSEPLKLNKKVRLIELFAGIGAQAKSLERLGVDFEHYRICEFDKYAVASYNAVHGTNFETSDITKIHAEDLGVVDTDKYTYVLTYSFPCFPRGSMVLTSSGYKSIEQVQVGDYVLSHDNKYHMVEKTYNNGVKKCYNIYGMGVDSIVATANHKFYVRSAKRVGHYNTRVFCDPLWKEVSQLAKGDYLGVAINQECKTPTWDGIDLIWSDGRSARHKNELASLMCNEDFWWIVGYYIGDGWQRKQCGIILSANEKKLEDLKPHIDSIGWKYSIVKERTAYKVHIATKEIGAFMEQFGKYADKKHLPGFVYDLPVNLLEALINGYMRADGCKVGKLYEAATTSRELAYGICQCVAKVYKTPYRVYSVKLHKTAIIEGRIVNQKPQWQICWKTETCKQDKAFYENGYIWYPYRGIVECGEQEVFDIEVNESHSFTVQNTIVHNCTDLSLAGKREGMSKGSGTRSGLLWEVERLLDELNLGGHASLPQILLMENVPQVVGQKNIADFADWIAKLDGLGYKSKWKILNATGFGIPQNRERCFMVSWLGDYYYDFPNETPLKKRLKDLLEEKVDESYYLKDEVVNKLVISDDKYKEAIAYDEQNKYVRMDGTVGTLTTDGSSPKHNNRVQGDGEISPTLTAGNQEIGVIEPIVNVVGRLESLNGHDILKRVYDTEHVSPAMTTFCGGNQEPKILERGFRVRKLTPRECWRLMGFDDEDFDKASKVVSKSQLYKQAGNSIVVQVLEAIFKQML